MSFIGEVLPRRSWLEGMTSVPSEEVTQVLSALASLGCDSAWICREIGVDTAHLNEPFVRLPIAAFDRLFERAEQQSGDMQIGLHTAERASSASTSNYLFRTQGTAREALEEIVRFQELLFGAHTVELIVLKGHAVWMFAAAPNLASCRHATEYFLSRRCRALYAEVTPLLVPVEVHFKHPATGPICEYERILRCPVYFEARQHAAVFANEEMNRRLRGTNPTVAVEIERLLRHQLDVLREADLCGRVKLIMRAQLLDAAPCDRDTVARRLAFSSRTLQRRLEDEEVTFRELLDVVRKDLAEELLTDRHLAIRHVSRSCGFTEVSAFYRAFRRWTGVGPNVFRATARSAAEQISAR